MATLKYWDVGSSSYVLLSGGVGPAGGTANQLLVKNSGTDYDTKWAPLQVSYVPPQAPPGSGKNFYTDAAGEVWASLNGSAWQKASQVIKSRLYRNAAWSPTLPVSVPFDTYDIGSTWNLSNGTTWTCPVTGDYLYSVQAIANVLANNWLAVSIRKGGTVIRTHTAYNSNGGANNVAPHGSDVVQFATGDTSDVYFSTNQSGALAGGVGIASTFVSYRFLSAQ